MGLYRLYLWTAIASVITVVILLFIFDDAPKYAPGAARMKKIIEEQNSRDNKVHLGTERKLFGNVLCQIVSDRDAALLMLAYGVNVDTGYAIQTLLNQMIAGSDWEQ